MGISGLRASVIATALSALVAGALVTNCNSCRSPASTSSGLSDFKLSVVPGQSVHAGQGVYFTISGATRGAAVPLRYEWSVTSAPREAKYQLNQFGNVANLYAHRAGEYRLSVRLTDQRGVTGDRTIVLHVDDAPQPEPNPAPEGASAQRPCREGDETLKEFAARCDKAMGGVSVPAFDCDDPSSTEPRWQDDDAGNCGAPNVLDHVCDPGSHFHVLHRDEGNDGIYIVAHCRKKAYDGNGDGQFGDVAAIQYNSKTGATCFYQAFTTGLPHDAPAPISGDTSFWLTPKQTAEINCVRCHDNGALIRSPYLAQLGQVWPFDGDLNNPNNPNRPSAPAADINYLPGTLKSDVFGPWNQSMPYSFVGLNFQSWQAYSVTNTSDSTCTQCHRMGISHSFGSWNNGHGTSADFGIKATETTQAHKLSHGKLDPGHTSPIWMRPGQFVFDTAVANHAIAMKTCAEGIMSGNAPGGCSAASFASGDTCPPANVVVNGSTGPVDTNAWQSSGKQPLGQPGGRTGFYYFTTIHGPFYQNAPWDPYMNAPAPVADPPWDPPVNASGFRGTYLRIYVEPAGQWMVAWGMDATDLKNANSNPPPPGGPGGEIAGVAFDQIDSVPDPGACGSRMFGISDKTGSHSPLTAVIDDPAGNSAAILSGLIGNVSRVTRDPPTAASLGILASGGRTILRQTHENNPAPSVNQWFTAESWANACGGWQAGAHYAVQHVQSTNDVPLVPSSEVPNSVCYIDGINGDWAQWRPDGSGGLVVPYAKIYIDPATGYRLKVWPDSTQHNGVSAFATCLYLKN